MSTEIVKRHPHLKILGDSFELLPNALIVHGQPTRDEYNEAFQRLSLIESAQSWWWGDLANARERDYGSLKEMAEKYGKDYGALANCQYVASRYEVSHRCETLGFKHHQITAPLEGRLEWLKRAKDESWTTSRLQDEIHRAQARAKRLMLPPGTFTVIYADPPWQYNNVGVDGAASKHYETTPLEEIAHYTDPSGTPIQSKFASDSVLFLWVTNPFLRDAFAILDEWGFQYKTNIVWVKTGLKKPGAGFYVRGRHELLFICTKGSLTPYSYDKTPIGSVLETETVFYSQAQEHSQKPKEIYELIEELYPPEENMRYLELFSRNNRPGWTTWGDEIR